MDDYVREFVEESEESITELNTLLLELERSPDDDAVVDEIFRTAHTLKGNAGAMGLDRVSDLAHALEDLLDAIRTDTVAVSPSLMDTIFDALDCLETMLDEVARRGTIETDASATIRALREPLSDRSEPFTEPTDAEIDATLARFDPPSNPDHDAFLVRLSISESGTLNNGLVVIEALIDAFDLLGTDPSRTAIENDEHGDRIDAVFASAVGKSSIAAALEPVDAVEAFHIVPVSDRFEQASSRSADSESGDDLTSVDLSSDEANEMSVDDLLDEFDELDDIDALAEDIEDASEFEDIDDAGSFDDLFDDAGTTAEPEWTTADESDDTSEDVDDASAVFEELKSEVEMVGFDELQDEIAELEFDEYDDQEEIGMDELLGDDIDVDDPTFLDVEADTTPDAAGDDDAEATAWDPPGDGGDPDSDVAPAAGSEANQSGDGRAEPGDSEPDWIADARSGQHDGQTTESDVDPAERIDSTEDSSPVDSEADGSEAAESSESPVEADPSEFADALFAGAETDESSTEADSESAAVDRESDDESDQPTIELDAPDSEPDNLDADSGPVDGEGDETAVDEDAGPAPDEAEDGPSPVNVLDRSEDGSTDADPTIEPEEPSAHADTAEDTGADESESVDDADEAVDRGPSFDETDDAITPDGPKDDTWPTDDASFDDVPAAEASDSLDTGDFDESTVETPAGLDDLDALEFDATSGSPGDDTFDDGPDSESWADDEPVADDFTEMNAEFDEDLDLPDTEFDDELVADSASTGQFTEFDDSSFGDDKTDTAGSESIDDESEDPILDNIAEMESPAISVPDQLELETDSELEEGTQSVRVDHESIDSLLQLVEGLVNSRVRLRSAVDDRESYETLSRELDDLEEITTELQDTVMDVRLVPLDTVTNRLPRVVRDLAREQDKQIEFERDTAGIELDRSLLDQIRDPLIHLVRNAVDHGIETPEARESAGKPPEGTITLSADRARDRVTIEVRDDGSGLDADRIRQAAIEAEVISESESDDLSDDEVYDLVFHPGLSTVDEVTDVSGRGVGMDVVRRAVETLNGTVSVSSEPGDGTTVAMTVPVSVAIDDVLFVESDGEQFGLPVDVVQDIVDGRFVATTEDGPVYDDEEETLPVVELGSALDSDQASSDVSAAANGDRVVDDDGMVVRVRDDVRSVALHCDIVHGRQEVVVKPFEGFMRNVPGVGGATVRGRGEVITILDVATI